MLSVVAASVGVLAIGGASWAVTTSTRSAGPAEQPSVTVTVTASAGPDATDEAAAPSDESAEDLDGIAADEYPEAAATRTDPNADLEQGDHIEYPDALVMEDWVWDYVGEGWSLEVASVQGYAYNDDGEWVQPAAVIYVVSPEDVYFEVAELPERMWNDARVASWVEGEEYVRIAWGLGEAGRYDLRTGTSEDLEFAVYGAASDSVSFVAADAAGDELWRAHSANGVKYYRWTESGGWKASALVAEAPEADWLATTPGLSFAQAVSGDGETVVLTVDQDNGDFVAYDLAADTVTSVSIPELGGQDYLVTVGVGDSVWVSDSGHALSFQYSAESGAAVEGTWPGDAEDWDGRVSWGLPTDAQATWFWCGC